MEYPNLSKEDSKYLNKTGKTLGFEQALKNNQIPLYIIDIYQIYKNNFIQFGGQPVLYITEVYDALLEQAKTESDSVLKLDIHWQGTTFHPSAVFFTNPNESKEDAINRIMNVLFLYHK